MRKWAQAFRQTTTYLGVAVIVIIWSGIYLLASQEREHAYQDAVRQGSNLTRVLQEYIKRVVAESDGALLALRREYQNDPQHFDIAHWVARTQPPSDLTVQFGVTDADGFVKQSSLGPISSPIYVADRAHFKFQRDSTSDELYISEPVLGYLSKKLTIQFTRRLSKPDGSFDGTVLTSLDVTQLENFFSSLDIGRAGIVSLVGTDGIVRARGGPDPATRGFSGKIVTDSPMFAALRQNSTGHYWNSPTGSARFDGVGRLLSYRQVSGLPLIAVVGLAKKSIFLQADATLQKYLLAGTILTIIVIIVMALGVAHQARLQELAHLELKRQADLAEQSARLIAAIENMTQGLSMFNKHGRLVVCNSLYAEMYQLPDDLRRPGTPLVDIIDHSIRMGIVKRDRQEIAAAERHLSALAQASDNHRASWIREHSNGDLIRLSRQLLRDGGWVTTHEDITEQRRAQQELDETKRFLDSIIENIPVAVVVKDAKTRKYLLVNRAFEAMLDMPRSELLGRTVFEIFKAEDAKLINDTDSESLYGSDGVRFKELEVQTPIRGLRIQATHRIVMRDRHGEAKCVIAVIEDVTDRKKSDQRIAFLAHHDALTGLANRAALTQKIDEAAARQRRRGEPFTVLLLDLDRFKQVNDTLGHPAGDALLTEVATRLRTLLRETDVLARLGGDEFAIIQAGEPKQREAAAALADRIIEILGQPFVLDGGEINIGTSIGIALAPEHDSGSDPLLKMADLALYRAKSAGRNGYRFFDPQMSEIASARQEIENDLRRALQHNEMELHYQPIIDTKTRKICSVEALVRWRHPTKGLIFPDLFIPLAEETGLITQIGQWVLDAACTEAATWPAHVKIAVNLSLVQFHKANLSEVVLRALASSGMSAERLELEITETALIESAAECLPTLRQFKAMGITIVLDDFGTGYSSLSQLAMFPFDKIKIDKSFIQNMTKRSECAAIISATLTLAQSLDIATTAEGVETVDQYRLLRLAGVTSLQGYLFKRPCPASEIDFDATYGGKKIEQAA